MTELAGKWRSDPSGIGALWLCAPVARDVTRTTIPLDGGWTAQ